ncbi:MAG: ribonuclease Z [Bacteroidales bacterium]|nr:ribonuclease Z [Bacteroidales bacterium]
MKFSVFILGCFSAAPKADKNTSAQLVDIKDELFLLDCGEGTQMQFSKYNIRFSRINNIFISHLHGDHYLGLTGLLFTYHLLRREKELNIYAPNGLEEIINLQLKAAGCNLLYPLKFHIINTTDKAIIFENDKIIIEAFPLFHRIETYGFLFKEKNTEKNISKSFLEIESPDFNAMKDIKRGFDYINKNGKLYRNNEITLTTPLQRSYAYCSDTAFHLSIVDYIKGVDLLYFESTFLNKHKELAKEKGHSTTTDAATIASMAAVKNLIVGHFSGRYSFEEISFFLDEALLTFQNTKLALTGSVFYIDK